MWRGIGLDAFFVPVALSTDRHFALGIGKLDNGRFCPRVSLFRENRVLLSRAVAAFTTDIGHEMFVAWRDSRRGTDRHVASQAVEHSLGIHRSTEAFSRAGSIIIEAIMVGRQSDMTVMEGGPSMFYAGLIIHWQRHRSLGVGSRSQ